MAYRSRTLARRRQWLFLKTLAHPGAARLPCAACALRRPPAAQGLAPLRSSADRRHASTAPSFERSRASARLLGRTRPPAADGVPPPAPLDYTSGAFDPWAPPAREHCLESVRCP